MRRLQEGCSRVHQGAGCLPVRGRLSGGEACMSDCRWPFYRSAPRAPTARCMALARCLALVAPSCAGGHLHARHGEAADQPRKDPLRDPVGVRAGCRRLPPRARAQPAPRLVRRRPRTGACGPQRLPPLLDMRAALPSWPAPHRSPAPLHLQGRASAHPVMPPTRPHHHPHATHSHHPPPHPTPHPLSPSPYP